jgi:hypothetical protein
MLKIAQSAIFIGMIILCFSRHSGSGFLLCGATGKKYPWNHVE